MNFAGGSVVIGPAGDEIGTLVGVGINAETNQVLDLVVRGHVGTAPLLIIPVQSVSESDENEILLVGQAIAEREMGGGVQIGHGIARRDVRFFAMVAALDGELGPLRRLICDQYTFDIEELIIGPGEWLPHEVGVPMDWVREIGRHRIVLSCGRDELSSLPPAPDDR